MVIALQLAYLEMESFFLIGINKKEEFIHFARSKHVKSNQAGIYDNVVEKLKNRNKILFIGLPCRVAAVKSYIVILLANISENLYTVDLL